MEKQKQKIQYQNYIFQLHFKTQYCVSMTVYDKFTSVKYQNNNVQFSKIKSTTILNALQQRNSKQFTVKFEETCDKKIKCLILQFCVHINFVVPFSQKVVLHQIADPRAYVFPQKINNVKAKQIKKQVDRLDKLFNSKEIQQDIQIAEIPSRMLQVPSVQQDFELYGIIGTNLFLFFVFIFYLDFWTYLICQAVLMGGWWIKFRMAKHNIHTFTVKKGTYKVQVSGVMTLSNYQSVVTIDSFLLYVSFDSFNYHKKKIHLANMYGYGYPFSATFIIESDKQQDLSIMIQKNTKIYTATISNTVIVCQKFLNVA